MAKIQVGILAGYPHSVLWAQLGLPKTTFYIYYDRVCERTARERLKKQDRLLHEFFTRMEHVISELDSKYRETGDTRILKDKADIIEGHFDRLQNAGFIPKRDPGPSVAIQNNVMTSEFEKYVFGQAQEPKTVKVSQSNPPPEGGQVVRADGADNPEMCKPTKKEMSAEVSQ